MFRPFFLRSMNVEQANSISLPTDEFYETLNALEGLLALNLDPSEFIIEDSFHSSSSVKVDLRQHLKNLHQRMSEIKDTLTPNTEMVTIDFN